MGNTGDRRGSAQEGTIGTFEDRISGGVSPDANRSLTRQECQAGERGGKAIQRRHSKYLVGLCITTPVDGLETTPDGVEVLERRTEAQDENGVHGGHGGDEVSCGSGEDVNATSGALLFEPPEESLAEEGISEPTVRDGEDPVVVLVVVNGQAICPAREKVPRPYTSAETQFV